MLWQKIGKSVSDKLFRDLRKSVLLYMILSVCWFIQYCLEQLFTDWYMIISECWLHTVLFRITIY